MTGRELYKAVAALGYQTSLEFDGNFFAAANIALCSVSRVTSEKKSVFVNINDDACGFIDMLLVTDDFDSFSSFPVKELEKGKEYTVEGSSKIVFLKKINREGVTVEYKKRPTLISYDNFDMDIDIYPALSDLLVLLTAFYVLLDDDPDKAMVYFTRYNEEAERAIRSIRSDLYESVINVTGW